MALTLSAFHLNQKAELFKVQKPTYKSVIAENDIMSIEVLEVKTKKQIREFIEFPLKLYKDNPYFVPPLYSDEKKMFKKNYVYADQAEWVCFNAYKDGKTVGRIQAILQKAANKKWGQNRVRFTRFDAIDEQAVANALFEAVENYAREKGMDEVVGPLGFSDLEREGLLIEGFDWLNTFEEQYNYPYYQGLIENLGYEKEVDWLERRLYKPTSDSAKIKSISERMMKKYNLHYMEKTNTNDFLKKYGDKFFQIIDTTYDKIYGTVPFTDGMRKIMIDNFRLIIDVRFVHAILDENDNVVCFGICCPAIGEAVQKSGGRLTLGALLKLLKILKKPKALDLALIGVIPEYESKGIATALLAMLMDMIEKVDYAETNLNLENNLHVQNLWKHFDNVQHKRRRCFVKKIK